MGKFSEAVILVTPSFAQWFNDDSGFLRHAVQKIFGSSGKQTSPLTVLTAVVDQLPPPSQRYIAPAGTKEWESGLYTLGYEGVSLLVGRKGVLPSTQDDVVDSDNGDIQNSDLASTVNTARLGFVLTEPYRIRGNIVRRRAEIPLANTIFGNGRRWTMSRGTWNLNGITNEYEMTEQLSIDSQQVEIDYPNFRFALDIPLISLTKQRRVASSMGNIVRQVTGEEGKDIPASQELEKAVSQYVQSNNPTRGRVLVYALVSKRGLMPEEMKDPGNGEQATELVRKLLLSGSSLHRVISGGGGWGQKQGLLSLDHQPSLRQVRTDTPESYDSGPDAMMSGLDAVAGEGTWIKFFVAFEPDPNLKHDVLMAGSQRGKRPWTLPRPGDTHSRVFGVGPANDSSEAMQPVSNSISAKVLFFPNHFGALSEQRMIVSTRHKPIQSMDNVNVVLSDDNLPGGTRRTQVDVPFSSLEFCARTPSNEPGSRRGKAGGSSRIRRIVFRSRVEIE